MGKPLDELYLTWLSSQVIDLEEKNPALTYHKLLKQLYITRFVELEDMERDWNRAQDGKDLRYEFIQAKHVRDPDPDWIELDCSMLELMVGLSRELAFEAGGKPPNWFMILLENLGLLHWTDVHPRYLRKHVGQILDDVNYRRYDPTGKGGFFPLKHPEEDQRDVELYYQLCAYILEQG